MPNPEIIGLISGALTSAGLIPQVVRVFRLKSAHEISLLFTVLFLAGGICWLSYGVFLNLRPVILWNSITLIFVGALLYAKLRYGR